MNIVEIKTINEWHNLLLQAENGDTHAMNEVAFVFREGLKIDNAEIVQIDNKQAFNWTKKAYENGDFEAMEKYADYLTERENGVCKVDVELGMKLYQKCIDNGSKNATFSLGLEYRNKQQFEKAFELYEQSQQSEGFYSELTLGLCYYYGIGVKKNKLKSLELFLEINSENNSQYEIDEANYLIGEIYLQGEVVEQDIDKARYYLELADKDGDHRSAQELLIVIGRTKNIN
jgi:uncharacterized protein